jgi:hypothetical protein
MSRGFFKYVAALVLCAFAPMVTQAQPKLSYDELDKLVRPIALYPDSVLVNSPTRPNGPINITI